MTAADLPAIIAIADELHPDYPEDETVFANRLALYSAGCLVLADGEASVGYVVSHPWHFNKPPALNVLLKNIPSAASTYYIHDLAVLPEARKTGAAGRIIDDLARHAAGLKLPNMSLVAVNNSVHFWERQNFRNVDVTIEGCGSGGFQRRAASELDQKLRSYGDHACYMIRPLT